MNKLHDFHKLSLADRINLVKRINGMDNMENRFTLHDADYLVENVLSLFKLPFSIATNFKINKKEYLVPMVIEEPSVIAAASNGAKMTMEKGGFIAEVDDPIMIGEIFVKVDAYECSKAISNIRLHADEIKFFANQIDPILVEAGGGFRNFDAYEIWNDFVLIHIYVDVRDAMGANIINTICEKLSPLIEDITGGNCYYKIVSNLATKRLTRAAATFSKDLLGGKEIVNRIFRLGKMACLDEFRKATHIKGIMNGIDALMIATGNDWRAVESAAYSYVSHDEYHLPLTVLAPNRDGDLVGTIKMPIPCGIIGGATSSLGKVGLDILKVKSSGELSMVAACLGLSLNVAALRAIADEGIQEGHLKLVGRSSNIKC